MGSFTGGGFGGGGFGGGGFGAGGVAQPLEFLPRDAYMSLITSEYQASPNFMAFLQALIAPLFDLIELLAGFDDAFDLDQAVGVQLDMLGTIVGAARTVPFIPTGGVSAILDDPTYRILLKARIAWNNWGGKMGSLQGIWANLFPGGSITVEDNQNMTATVVMTGAFNSIILDLINNGLIVPRPQGVLYNYVTPAGLPMFGFDLETSFISGFDVGKWT